MLVERFYVFLGHLIAVQILVGPLNFFKIEKYKSISARV